MPADRKQEPALIQVERLDKHYQLGEIVLPVLRSISLSVARGEYVALMGASGSGKSTLMNILGLLDRPSAGEYRLEGREVSRLPADELAALRNAKIGFVFQNFNLLSRTTALDNVMLPLLYSRSSPSREEASAAAANMLRRVGLGDRLMHHPSQLSGGQQQRVAIARALINSPSILFADEPTGNLDSHTNEEIMEMFGELNRTENITVVLVTHDSAVAAHAGRVLHIKDGVLES